MRPDIVFLTTGCANSTITMRMLEALGWNLGDVRPPYAENWEAHRINIAMSKGEPFDRARAEKEIARLPRPWAIKDPKFAYTLQHWLPVFAPYAPLMVYVTKDMSYVRKSFARRFEASEPWDAKRKTLCDQHFGQWPHAKIHFTAESIAAAVALFSPARSVKFAGRPNP